MEDVRQKIIDILFDGGFVNMKHNAYEKAEEIMGLMKKPDAGADVPLDRLVMCEYSQGICQDGAAILKDGQPMTIESILAELRKGAGYDKELEEAHSLLNALYGSGIDLQEHLPRVRAFFGLST